MIKEKRAFLEGNYFFNQISIFNKKYKLSLQSLSK